MTLRVDVNCPRSQEDLVNNWEPAHSLVEDNISGAEIAPCLPAVAVACLPLCLRQGKGPVPAGWLSFGIGSILCSVSGPSCALEFFAGKFSLFFFLSLAIPQFGLLSHISSLRLSSGHLGLVLTLSNAASTSLFSPRLLLVVVSIWATSPLGVVVRHIICGFYLFFSSQLFCPQRFQNSPQAL